MTPRLAEFFETIGPFFAGRLDLGQLENTLGSSPTGSDGLAYYRTLVDRNFHKILGDVFGSVRRAVVGRSPDDWSRLVRDYARSHPRAAPDPNDFGEAFSDYLRVQTIVPGGETLAELADFHWISHRCAVAPDPPPGDDGVDLRVFVRQYSFDAPRWRRMLMREPPADTTSAEIVHRFWRDRECTPTFVIVFRNLRTLRVEVMHADFAHLEVLAARAGVDADLPFVPDDATRALALTHLVNRGVLRCR